MNQQHQEKSSQSSWSWPTKKRTINIRSASITPIEEFMSIMITTNPKKNINTWNPWIAPREELMNITITINHEKDNQHNKCINNTKRKAHEHHHHDRPRRGPSTHEVHQQHQEKSSWTSQSQPIRKRTIDTRYASTTPREELMNITITQSPLTRKRMINTVNARTTPRKRFMNITIMFDQKEDHQHKKCIKNSKRGVFKNHDLQWPLQSPL